MYGVRGLMLDIDLKTCSFFEKLFDTCSCQGICLCHGDCSRDTANALKDGFAVKTFEYALKKIVRFLDKNKDEIITLFLEDYIFQTKQLQDVFDRVKGFNQLVFNPYSRRWNVVEKGWPKIKDMIAAKKRLLIVDDEQRGEHAGKPPGIMRYRDFFIENHYAWHHSMYEWDVTDILNTSTVLKEALISNSTSLINGTTIELEMSECFSRQQSQNRPMWDITNPLKKNRTEGDGELLNSQKLFLFNHFYGVAALQPFLNPLTVKLMNTREYVLERLREKCDPGTDNLTPNFIALDFIDAHVHDDLIRPFNLE